MRRTTTHGRGSVVRSATLNAMQDEAAGLVLATDAPATVLSGADGRWWETADAGLASGTLRVIDTSVDWRGRRVWGVFRRLGDASRRFARANDHLANDPASATILLFEGATGTGGKGLAAATIADGTPPVLADNQLSVVLEEGASSSARVWLYARPDDGALCVYNNSGTLLHGDLRVFGAGAPPDPTTPPPDVIPTLTEVQWIEPSTAALRPSDPGGPAIHRATDTGALTLFDGGAWRSLGGATAGTAATVTTTHSAAAGDVLLCDATGGAFTVTLPAAAGATSPIALKKIDASANAITVDGAGSETIDGAATRSLSTQYEAVSLWSDGSNWWVF